MISVAFAVVVSVSAPPSFLKLLGQVTMRETMAISHNPIYTQPERIGRMFSQGDGAATGGRCAKGDDHGTRAQ